MPAELSRGETMGDVLSLIGDVLVAISVAIAAFAAKWARDAAHAGRDTVAPLQLVAAGMEAAVAEQRQLLEASRELAAVLRDARHEARLEARLRALQHCKAAIVEMWHGIDFRQQGGPEMRLREAQAALRGALALLPPKEFDALRRAAGTRWNDGSLGQALADGEVEVDKAVYQAHQDLAGLFDR
jgi:hypothetical protein